MKDMNEFISKLPATMQGLRRRVLDGTASPRQVIKAKCQECVSWEDVSNQIRGCQARRCALWGMRPYQDMPTLEVSTAEGASPVEEWGAVEGVGA